MDYKKFAEANLRTPSTLKSYNATYNAHLRPYENGEEKINIDVIPQILNYVKHSNRRQSTKNSIIVLLCRMMIFSGISHEDVMTLKHQFNDTDKTDNSRKTDIEKFIEGEFKRGRMKSYVINFLSYNYDLNESELKTLTISNKSPTTRDVGIFVRPNYVSIQSKNYNGFDKYGMKKIRIFQKRIVPYLKEHIGETLISDNESETQYLFQNLTHDDYATVFTDGLCGSKLSEYSKYM